MRINSLILPLLLAPTSMARSYKESAFVLVGDSTTNNATVVPNSGGWGNGFTASVPPTTYVANFAANGATTGTIVTNGNYSKALNATKQQVALGKAVFVTFQFGHNDMKIAPPSSMGANLTKFVSDVRALGAHPILISPLSRRSFLNVTSNPSDATSVNVIDNQLLPWVIETKLIAQQTNTTYLPLNERSTNYLQSIGPSASWKLNRLPDDYTHLNLGGQNLFGRMVADLMAVFVGFESVYETLSPFVPNPDLSLALAAGQQYVFEAVCPSCNATECIGDIPRPGCSA